MASFPVVEHLDVIKQVGARVVSGSIADAIDAFAFEQAKEALNSGVVRHGRYVTFQLAEVAVPRDLFRKILRLIDGLRPAPLPP